MKKILVFSVLLLSAIAVTTGTTITTTIQIQPAYSQAQHCGTGLLSDRTTCVTPGKDPSVSVDGFSRPITHQDIGQAISREHQGCAHGFAECTVTPP